MSGAIGHTFIYNIIIIFIVIVFGFLAGTMSYYKAFKVNNRIVSSIEKFEGYNLNASDIIDSSIEEINRTLGSIGYSADKSACKEQYKGMYLVESSNDSSKNPFRYCIYINDTNPSSGEYYTYGVLTYMNIDLPFINRINIPIFTKTNRIYKFTTNS